MVEPNPANLAAGRANFSRNGFEGEFIQATVAAGQWDLPIYFIQSRNISHIDILHVDIQGYEAEFMPGARETLSRAIVDYLFVSTHSQLLHQHIVSGFVKAGYRIDVSSDFDNDTASSFDSASVFASKPASEEDFQPAIPISRTHLDRRKPPRPTLCRRFQEGSGERASEPGYSGGAPSS